MLWRGQCVVAGGHVYACVLFRAAASVVLLVVTAAERLSRMFPFRLGWLNGQAAFECGWDHWLRVVFHGSTW
jgi:hypothetical protein